MPEKDAMDLVMDDSRGPANIPLPIIQFVTQLVDTRTGKFETMLARHIKSEESQIAALTAQITALSAQLSVFLAKQEQIEKAFLETDHGTPDFAGHYTDHRVRKKFGEFVTNAKNNAIMKIIEYLSVGAVVAIGVMAWKALLAGPQ